MQAMSIGLPTNVTHQGHATSIEDAQSLIEKLMVGRGASLPPPLLPESGETTIYTSLLTIVNSRLYIIGHIKLCVCAYLKDYL